MKDLVKDLVRCYIYGVALMFVVGSILYYFIGTCDLGDFIVNMVLPWTSGYVFCAMVVCAICKKVVK